MKDRQVSAQIAQQLPKSLPSGLLFTTYEVRGGDSPMGKDAYSPDVIGTLQAGSNTFPVVVEVQNTGGTASLREVARQAVTCSGIRNDGSVPMVGGRFFGERAREVAKEEHVALIDLAGNFYLEKGNTYIERIVDKNPYSQKLPLNNLFSPVSSRITRVLLTEPERVWLLGELAKEANVSIGQTYQVINRMREEEIVEKKKDGKLFLKKSTQLLEAWKKAYPTYQQQKYTLFSYEQDYNAILDSVIKAGQREKIPYALGFFTGADLIAPFIRGLTKVQLYTQNSEDVQKWKTTLNLQEVQSGGNVEICLPYDGGVWYKPQYVKSKIVGDIPIVNNVQLYMDLFNNPARGEEAAKRLREAKLQY